LIGNARAVLEHAPSHFSNIADEAASRRIAGREALRHPAFIEETGDLVAVSARFPPPNLEAAGDVPPAPSSAAERLALWFGRLPSPAPDMP
jgi:hypothetical protein